MNYVDTCLNLDNRSNLCAGIDSGIPRNFFRGWGGQQIQLRTEGRENGDLGALAP
jgi:hypothetical protein